MAHIDLNAIMGQIMASEPIAAPAIDVRLGPQGRIVVPAELRRALGLQEGALLCARIDDGRLVLEPRREVLRRLRGRFAKAPATVSLSEELITDRAKEARRETKR